MKDPTKLRVLYLEDDEDSKEIVSFLFALSNIEVVIAKTLQEAWLLANTENFDLFLLDGLIEGGSSLKLCKDLHGYAPSTPILFYSALAYKADILNGMNAGADDYLVKPYFGDLSEKVKQTVRKAENLRGN